MTQSICLCISALLSLSHFLTYSFPTRKAEMGLCDMKQSLGNGPSLGLTGTFDPLGKNWLSSCLSAHQTLSITSSAGPGQCQHTMGWRQSCRKLQRGRGVPGWFCSRGLGAWSTGVKLTLPGAQPQTREACQLFLNCQPERDQQPPFLFLF